MAVPTTREEFKQYCLRKMGSPVIEVNVSDEQIEDRIDESLRYYWDYHFDGTEKLYYKHQITLTDKTNKYISMPENIIGVVSIFDLTSGYNGSGKGLFDIKYQIALNDLYSWSTAQLTPYYMTMQHLSLLQEMLVGKQLIRYNRHRNRLNIDMDWDRVEVGEYIVIEAYEVVDPGTFSDVWADRWLQNYTTSKIKYQWAWNMSKYSAMVLPGGVQFNADRMMDEAKEEISNMEGDMLSSFSLPVSDMLS